jgi:ssDNA-binding Zn-finger/Zn-ribbon topoisomerase 1
MAVWAFAYLAVNFVTVSRWRTVPLPHAVLNVFTGTAVLKGWPAIEPDEWILVDAQTGTATTQYLSGSAGDWLGKLEAENVRAYRANITIRAREYGVWSVLAQKADIDFELVALRRADADTVERDWFAVRHALVESQAARGADVSMLSRLCAGPANQKGRESRLDIFWGFILNDLMVVSAAFIGAKAFSRWAIAFPAARRDRFLAANQCPKCRYDLSGLSHPRRCAECGCELPWPTSLQSTQAAGADGG